MIFSMGFLYYSFGCWSAVTKKKYYSMTDILWKDLCLLLLRISMYLFTFCDIPKSSEIPLEFSLIISIHQEKKGKKKENLCLSNLFSLANVDIPHEASSNVAIRRYSVADAKLNNTSLQICVFGTEVVSGNKTDTLKHQEQNCY